jgi:hypothetical protein
MLDAFPPQPFHGVVSTHDECDEGIALRRELTGKQWDEVPAEFVDQNSGSLPLLESDALVAFLPAWLLRAIEDFNPASLVLEFTLYFLSPGSEDDGWNENAIAKRVGLFNDAQKTLIAEFLQDIALNKELAIYHPYAEHGLKWWDAKSRSSLPKRSAMSSIIL